MTDIITTYTHICATQNVSHPVAAIKALMEAISSSAADNATMSELINQLVKYNAQLKTLPSIAVHGGCDLFMRTISQADTSSTTSANTTAKQFILGQGEKLLTKAGGQRDRIVLNCHDFVHDGSTLMLHGYSRVVVAILKNAHEANKRFFVYCTESRPSDGGYRAYQYLQRHGIASQLIMDSAAGYYMDAVDFVLVGAEGVVENGGLVNAVGTYGLAVLAKQANKSFYAAAESIKFVRLFPLNQYDLPHAPKLHQFSDEDVEVEVMQEGSVLLNALDTPATTDMLKFDLGKDAELKKQLLANHPTVDYTPPHYISLLFTDLGVLTSSGVSDELIKLYY